MKNDCGIVEDLLPLYLEGMTRPDTREFIDEHLAGCENCRSRLEELKTGAQTAAGAPPAAAAPLRAMRRGLWRQRAGAALLAVTLAAALLCSAFAVLTAPRYLSLEQAELRVELSLQDGREESSTRVEVQYYEQLAEKVERERKEAYIKLVPGPDGVNVVVLGSEPTALSVGSGGARHMELHSWLRENGGTVYEITAWNTALDDWRPAGEPASLSIRWQEGDSLYYTPNDGTESVLLYGPGGPDDGIIGLPRLALGYYLLTAAAAALVLALASVLLRGRPARAWPRTLFWLPVCWLAGQLLVKGTATVSYNLTRDLALISLTALALYTALLLARAVWRFRHPKTP